MSVAQLADLLKLENLTHVVDIGANPIDGDPPYKPLLTHKRMRLTGFEPQTEAFAELERRKSPLETYFPYAIGDGRAATLRICKYGGWSSLKKPNPAYTAAFHNMAENSQVLDEQPLQTHRLDDISEIARIDYLKIDAQGSELDVFQNGMKKLKDAVIIHTEAFFLPIYEDQPLFADQDAFLRSRGFIPHFFPSWNIWAISPLFPTGQNSGLFKQVVDCDIVYVKNFLEIEAFSLDQLKHLALIAHVCYRSADLTGRCIVELQKRGAIAQNVLERYVVQLNQGSAFS